ncbi:phosphate ABC transporter permease PstA, partial [Candidatus Sumerlaeota bacterium]|nr:phosphate ABC transporter permease PstA [Candidatus Sumerlaeota bacterium]
MIRLRIHKITDVMATIMISALSLLTVLPLILIVGYIVFKGFRHFSIDLFTKNPAPVGESGGGVLNGIVGSAIILGIASLIGIPSGVMGGVYLAEAKEGKMKHLVRLCVEILQGIPSIVIGIIGYALIVLPMRRFSAIAGGASLAIIMLPIIVISTEEVLRLVPLELKEGGVALGMRGWRVSLFIVLRTGIGGVISGILLSVSRIAGETAPLLFTALGSQFFTIKLDQPIAALPLQIYSYSISPYPQWHS